MADTGPLRFHLEHIAEAVLAEKKYRDGTLGGAFVETFETALGAVRHVIEEGIKDKDPAILLSAAKVAAEIAQMQATIEGAMPAKAGPGRPRSLPDAVGKPNVTKAEVDQAIADYQATQPAPPAARAAEDEEDDDSEVTDEP